MKTIVYFILLKTAEIGGMVLAYWGFCHLGTWMGPPITDFWSRGILPFFILLLSLTVMVIIYHFISWNWRKAKELAGKNAQLR